jgi:peptidoglycan-associated lipoprotein
MLKKIFAITVIILAISCQGKNKDISKDFKIEDKAISSNNKLEENITPYQTIEDEQQASEINKQSDSDIEEIEVQDRVFFGYDSSEIDSDAKKILDTQIAWLKSDQVIKIIIEGHCDERGTREYNLALGEKRANAAKNYLTQGGISSSRIKVVSYGKERPAFFGDDEKILGKNRRAVVVIKQ